MLQAFAPLADYLTINVSSPNTPGLRTLQGLRVGAWIDEPAMEIDAVMAGVLHAAVDAVEQAGAHIDRRTRPGVDVARAWGEGARVIGAAVSHAGAWGSRAPTHW